MTSGGITCLRSLPTQAKKEGLDTQGFIDYYEHHHVPLVLSLAPAPPVYKRNYGTPITDSQSAAVSMPAAPTHLSIPSPLSMTGSPLSVLLSP